MIDYEEEDRRRQEQVGKCGSYVDRDCPNCGRQRLMVGEDGKHRCEKCAWCVEESCYDSLFGDYIKGIL